jgi:hypothetical protein
VCGWSTPLHCGTCWKSCCHWPHRRTL